ncbi:MAG: HAD-IA family hydrolase [Desulfobacterales bacterium]|nr:HAD-IA family hydrolase [Desulfobacterales bacterium]
MIANRLRTPENTTAILWDMDGVLLDTLGLALNLCNELIQERFGSHVHLDREFIRSIFAHHIPEFWSIIREFVEKEYGVATTEKEFESIVEAYIRARKESTFEINPGIREILTGARESGLKMAVVSSNPTADVEKILSGSGILAEFDLVVGNDIGELKKKPAPDTYLHAAETLGVAPGRCIVVEDSTLGAEAGGRAGCFTIGVATGGGDFKALEQCPRTHQVYTSFHPNRLEMRFGKVTEKRIRTPNEFVSHMIEHIAWRLGVEIDLYWNNNDWGLLGETLGESIKKFHPIENRGAALGMIDDGSAEVAIELADAPGFIMESVERLDLAWFLNARCEQVDSGAPLTGMIEGLGRGLGARVHIRVCGMEDPHHAWEGIFRSIGIALNRMFTPRPPEVVFSDFPLEKNASRGDISVLARSCDFAEVERKTAESLVSVVVDFSGPARAACRFNVSPSIDVDGLSELLDLFAREAGVAIRVDFNVSALSSSHVVAEDTALVLGRALKEVLVLRMENFGANGAGSGVRSAEDFDALPIRAGVSVEGRKFWKFIPFNVAHDEVVKKFIVGHDVGEGLFSEDLDDFLDGLAGGLGCSIIIHIKELIEPDPGWRMIFQNLGKAFREVFAVNPSRKGVPPGVKATLA